MTLSGKVRSPYLWNDRHKPCPTTIHSSLKYSTACVGGTNLCYSLLLEFLVVCPSCAHLVLRGAKLSVVKKRRRKEVSEEMSIDVPVITRKFRMYFNVCVVN